MIWDNTTLGEKWPQPSDNPPGVNPFIRERGKIKSVTAISRAISENPQRAREMCRAAGEPVALWFGDNPK